MDLCWNLLLHIMSFGNELTEKSLASSGSSSTFTFNTMSTPCSLSDIAHLDHPEGDVLGGPLHHLQLWVEIHTGRTPKRLILTDYTLE